MRTSIQRISRPRRLEQPALDTERQSRLTVLIGDPLVTEDGRCVASHWRLPWARFADALFDDLRSTGQAWSLDILPATVDNAAWAIPRSRFVALLCHGDTSGVAFERDDLIGVRHPIFAAEQIGSLFKSHPPDMVLALSCKSEKTAAAIHAAGVPWVIGIERNRFLLWHEALVVTGAFFRALAARHTAQEATDIALKATVRATQFKIWRPSPSTAGVTLPPDGPAVAPRYEAWASHPPREVFVGREQELAQLLADVSRPGAVYLSGLPGVGKTELARALLDRSRFGRWPVGGSAWVPLAGVETAEGLVDALRLAITNSPERERVTSAGALGAALGISERLVVLDDIDDVHASADAREALLDFVRAALEAQPEARLRLVVTGTRQWPWPDVRCVGRHVNPLANDALAQKLLEGVVRGSFVQPHTQVTRDWDELLAHAGLARLMEALRGHPLSIVTAGQALRAGASLAEVTQQALATHGGGVAELLAGLAARLDRTGSGLALLASLLAEFPGGVPADIELTPQERADAAILRQHSIFDGHPDLWRVTQPFGHYLVERRRLAAEELDQRRRVLLQGVAARALVDYLTVRVGWLRGPRTAQALEAFEALRPTVEFLLDPQRCANWCDEAACKGRLTALAGELALYQALPTYALRWTEGAATVPDFEDDRARVLLVRAAALATGHDWAGVRGAAQLALEQAQQDCVDARAGGAPQGVRERHARVSEGRALRQLGDAQVLAPERSDRGVAEQLYRRALAVFQAAHDDRGVAQTLFSLGFLEQRCAHFDEADNAYTRALRLHRQNGDLLGAGRAQRALGEIALRRGRAVAARRLLSEALQTMHELGLRFDQASVQMELGCTHVALGQRGAALRCFEAARRTFENIGERVGQGEAHFEQGGLALLGRDYEAAAAEFANARALFDAVAYARGLARVDQRFGEIALRLRRPEEALRLSGSALEGAEATGDEVCAAAARLVEASVHVDARDWARGKEAALGAYQRAIRAGASDTQVYALEVLAAACRRSHPGASRDLRRALQRAANTAPDTHEVERILGRLRASPHGV